MKNYDKIIKEFREKFVISVFGFPKAEELESWLLSKLKEVPCCGHSCCCNLPEKLGLLKKGIYEKT